MQETDSPESATGGNMSGRAAEEEVSDMETVESGSYSEKKDTETDTEAVFKSTETGSVSGTTEADSTVGNYRSENESTKEEIETDADIFTQEEPDDVTESWSYIGRQYTVQRGDTLAGIAMKIYQSYDYIDVLAQANQIDNLDEIYPGQVLDIPPMED